jgi:hypothetical protein
VKYWSFDYSKDPHMLGGDVECGEIKEAELDRPIKEGHILNLITHDMGSGKIFCLSKETTEVYHKYLLEINDGGGIYGTGDMPEIEHPLNDICITIGLM